MFQPKSALNNFSYQRQLQKNMDSNTKVKIIDLQQQDCSFLQSTEKSKELGNMSKNYNTSSNKKQKKINIDQKQEQSMKDRAE